MEFLNVQHHQREALQRIFSPAVIKQQWKILIYDIYCKDIISPLLSLNKLHKLGVTLHLLLDSKRDIVPEVPVVYFIKPRIENILKLKQDCQNGLYDELYIHFAEPASEDILKALAKAMVETSYVQKVKKVYDQFLGFVSLEQTLFHLNIKNSFSSYNNPEFGEGQIMNYLDQVVVGLVNVITTLGINPIIRCPRDGPAAMLAQMLTKKLYLLVNDSQYQEAVVLSKNADTSRNDINKSLEELTLSSQRTVLLLIDRGVDLKTMLMHTSTYQTLVDDLLKIDSNRVTITDAFVDKGIASNSSASKPKVYSLEPNLDLFWQSERTKIIGEAVEHHSEQLKAVSAEVTKIKSQAGSGDDSSFEDRQTNGLLQTVESLPKLLEQKKLLEMHLELLNATMSIIMQRQVYDFAVVEEDIRKHVDWSKINELIDNPRLDFADKVRLLSICYLSQSVDTPQGKEQAKKCFEKLDAENNDRAAGNGWAFSSLLYIKKLRSLGSRALAQNSSQDARQSSVWAFADLAAQRFLDAHKHLKDMVSSEKWLPAVQMLDFVTKSVDQTQSQKDIDTEFLYYDPKIGTEAIPQMSHYQGQINCGVVFVLGGGCYSEYQNLLDYWESDEKKGTFQSMASGKKQKKRFIYGSTEMLNSLEFMRQAAGCFKG